MVNEVHIIGRLGKDPELRFTPSQKAVCNFTVATDDGSSKDNQTEWFSVVVWEKTAETCQMYLKKGKLVYVRGRLQTRSWETKDGTKAYKTEVIADRVKFLSPKEEEQGTPLPAKEGAGRGANETSYKPATLDDLDGIPF
jgi:single-strand DNA-binding protein